ncbi:hypothetical protein [Methylocystis sp.]|uniref:hypothetical protein n=1 Tax=Methylocystis sp. TaxID=1911079 RepID=UPI0025F767E2|nr:hypothetical protein [Methylocystis sp.]
MRIELTPGMTNVVRFPLERRMKPSLDLLWEIAPDSREVSLVIEAFGLDDDIDGIRDIADREMADYIANNIRPEPGAQRRAALDELLRPAVERAEAACRRAHEAAAAAVAAQRLVVKAQSEGGYWMSPLEERATDRSNLAARLLVDAHIACDEARGASRAIRLAKGGEDWRPFDAEEEANALFFGEARPLAAG